MTFISPFNVFTKSFLDKFFFTKSFLWVFWNQPLTGRNVGRGKVAYNWISPDPAKAGPILGGGGVVVVCSCFGLYAFVMFIDYSYEFGL